jgi:hypothetical protein
MAKKPGIQRNAGPPQPAPKPAPGEEPEPTQAPEEPDEGEEEGEPEEEEPPAGGEGREEAEEEQGTLASGYGESGPYSCGSCIHQSGGLCDHSVVVNDPALQMRRRGDKMPVNLQTGCCRFVYPPEGSGQGPVSEEVARPY